ncbi:MAG TPA: DNA-3-methyladenine glycosylase [Chlamydiales bacterium]|jgi:DNA-3-methyladenine glycosylase
MLLLEASSQAALPPSFYQRPDVVQVARDLLGKGLFTRTPDGLLTGGLIVETEAYAGVLDKASHVYNDRRTQRTEAMYGPGGIAYVYMCYGIHYLLNAVTNLEGVAQAVLIRALFPTHGIDTMLKRRKKQALDKTLASGPGALCQALGINLTHYAVSLSSPNLWIADCGVSVKEKEIQVTPRIGVDYAGEDAKLPYRFVYSNRWE